MSMAEEKLNVDVLIVGSHPCSYLAAALLRSEPGLRVMHVSRRLQTERKLALLNPAFFSLHPMLAPLEKRLKLKIVHGLKFLSDDFAVFCQHCSNEMMVYVCDYSELSDALKELARDQCVQLIENVSVEIHHLDERGLSVSVDGRRIYPAALILSECPEKNQQQLLGICEDWDHEVLYRFTSVTVPTPPKVDGPHLIRMSLDVGGTLAWGWLLVNDEHAQAMTAQPISTVDRHEPKKILRQWISVLKGHGDLPKDISLADSEMESWDLPLAGALAQEGIANRTLLIGPAGGFYSACGEDLYPNCWSAFFAADVVRKALHEKHLQDAINPYRMIWRTTLGEYLRGPQQNLRFLLPLMYRNQTMTTRFAEAILLGKHVVR
jgi:hypothetical protein